MKKPRQTLLSLYLSKTTTASRNKNPREEGLVAGLSDVIERENAIINLPKALPKLNEFHSLLVDSSKKEAKEAAELMTLCFAMCVIDKELTKETK